MRRSLAEQSGRYLALNPATGQPLGPGYGLRGSLAPAANPVAFGTDRLFTPLSDGTVMLLPINRLTAGGVQAADGDNREARTPSPSPGQPSAAASPGGP